MSNDIVQLFVDNLTVIDFSYLDSDRGLVGESWIVDINLAGQLDEQGMVFDFGQVKKQIKQFIDFEIDHRLLVPVHSRNCSTVVDNDELFIEFPLNSGVVISHRSPQSAVLLVNSSVIAADHVASILRRKIAEQLLPKNINEVLITLRNEHIEGAYYQYTHGLQGHLGACQRIAHGHRSRIEIEMDGRRCPRCESQWAEKLKDKYIATKKHVLEEFYCNQISHTRLAYVAAEGFFSICLPTSQVYMMPHVSTVENIAMHLTELTAKETNKDIKVKAFEGLGKGAFGAITNNVYK